ncbi:MAG: monovalent cation/H(+) antiporter subunit G [Verrucomicrobia bacterium]|nr:monovalent cation/H(+) antiporter subunit G [Verrucomicrobiota bacterium]
MRDVLVAVFIAFGAFYSLVSSIGLIRMPDLYNKLHAATKSSTLGSGCVAVAAMIFFDGWDVRARALFVIVFIFLTAPISGLVISKCGHLLKVPQWKGTIRDDLTEDNEMAGPLGKSQ